MFSFRKHPDCDHAHAAWDVDRTAVPIDRACDHCLLLHLFDRIQQMPTLDDLNTALATLGSAISTLGGAIASETSVIQNALATPGIPQSVIDTVNGSIASIQAATAAVQAEVPSSATT